MLPDELSADLKNETISAITVSAYKISTDQPESDGTFEWDHTTLVLVEIRCGRKEGIGYTYASYATSIFIEHELKSVIIGKKLGEIPAIFSLLTTRIRNNGTCGVAMMAVSALDIALWDLKAKILDFPLYKLLGKQREGMPIYGSGGFTSYTVKHLQDQLYQWADSGMKAVKMKIGRQPAEDPGRIKSVLDVLPKDVDLYIDANAAYEVKQAISLANQFEETSVTWFEEPVNSFHTDQLNFIRDHVPANIRIASGEYGYHPQFYKSFVLNHPSDIIQADITRCGGISGFLQIGALCAVMGIPFSSHCAPLLHIQPSMSLPGFLTGEYFYDHVRIEKMLFETEAYVKNGIYKPSDAPGLGISFKHEYSRKYKI